MAEQITVQTTVNAPMQKVWDMYNTPEHVMKWNSPSPDWHTPTAQNDFVTGGSFVYRMEAKDGSGGFDFGGTYDEIGEGFFKYTMGDGRKVSVEMKGNENQTDVKVMFDPENENTPEFQKQGWQAILDNFKTYVESN